MLCDKCGQEVKPQNNALLYDAALQALSRGKYRSAASGLLTIILGESAGTVRKGLIVESDPVKSIKNVLEHYYLDGRHLYPTSTCEGSPSRIRNIEKGEWGNGQPMGELAELAKAAYRIVKELETHCAPKLRS